MSNEEKKTKRSEKRKGPLKNRSCTDLLFLVIFIVFMTCWAGVGYYAVSYGNIEALLAPVDSYGRKCGLDDGVTEARYLVFFDLTACLNRDGKCHTPQVCREKCPDDNWYYEWFWEFESEKSIRKHMICETGINVMEKNKTELLNLIETEKCAKWHLNSTSIVGRCVPRGVPEIYRNVTLSDSKLQEAQRIIKALVWGAEILDAAIVTREQVLKLIAIGAASCLAYIFLLRWLAFPFVFISVTVLFGFLGYLSYYFYGRYDSENETKWLVLTIVFGVAALLIVLTVMFLLKRIRLACQLIEEASKAVVTIFSSLFFPILPWLFHLAAIMYFITAGLYLSTIETPEKWQFRVLITVHVTGFIWFYCFVTALGEMILASTFATWYWTFNKSDIPLFTLLAGAWRTFRYHLGTVAFGSLLITICRLIRVILEFIDQSSKKQGGLFHTLSRVCINCAKFLMKYVEKFLKFMNRNAYIVCAVYGKGLCSSASDALSLIIRNAMRVIVLNNMVSWLLWLGKILITVAMGVLTWWYYTDTDNKIEHWWVPVTFVVIGSYLVASVFFSVYAVAVDTIFLCFLEDCEHHDGSATKPYYMSRKLRKLLHKNF